jgi:hypothetical protein
MSGGGNNSQQFATTADALMPSLFQYLPENLWDLLMVPFDYSAIFTSTALAAGAAPFVTTAIQADSHFAMLASQYTFYTTATPPVTAPNAPILVRFQDTGSGMYLDDAPQPVAAKLGGTGGQPGYWAGIGVPYLLVANTAFNTALQNLDTANAYSAYIVHRGVKIFGIPRTTQAALPGS